MKKILMGLTLAAVSLLSALFMGFTNAQPLTIYASSAPVSSRDLVEVTLPTNIIEHYPQNSNYIYRLENYEDRDQIVEYRISGVITASLLEQVGTGTMINFTAANPSFHICNFYVKDGILQFEINYNLALNNINLYSYSNIPYPVSFEIIFKRNEIVYSDHYIGERRFSDCFYNFQFDPAKLDFLWVKDVFTLKAFALAPEPKPEPEPTPSIVDRIKGWFSDAGNMTGSLILLVVLAVLLLPLAIPVIRWLLQAFFALLRNIIQGITKF